MAVPSIPKIRSILAAPLVITNENASGDACYVLAGGNAIWERLNAASALYRMKRIPIIFIMQNGERSHYNFTQQTNWTQTQWAVSYLEWRGVPKERIASLDEAKGLFGTLTEAQNLAKNLPPNVRRLVLVTSAPHTRRSLLAFRKTLPPTVSVIPYAASPFKTSSERSAPIWPEYLKLLVYKIYLSL